MPSEYVPVKRSDLVILCDAAEEHCADEEERYKDHPNILSKHDVPLCRDALVNVKRALEDL